MPHQFALIFARILAALAVAACGDPPTTPIRSRVADAPLASVTLRASRERVDLIVGNSIQLTASVENPAGHVLPNRRRMTWASLRPAIASVDSTGLVTGLDTGEVMILATEKKVADTVPVRVLPIPVARIRLDPTSVVLEIGDTAQLTATPLDSLGRALPGRLVAWTSSAPAIARVDTGIVVALAAGSTTITVVCENRSATATVTVQAPAVTTVRLEPEFAAIVSGDVKQFTATALDRKGRVLSALPTTWSSSSLAIAEVDINGLALGKQLGVATITATIEGHSAAVRLQVTSGAGTIANVSISPKEAAVPVFEYAYFDAVARNAAGRIVWDAQPVFESLDPTIAIMDGAGALGEREGVARIVAFVEGKADTARLAVIRAPVANVTVSVSPPSVAVFGSGCPPYSSDAVARITALARNGQVLPLSGRTVEWTIGGGSIVFTVGGGSQDPGTRQITGVRLGRDTLFATVDGVRGFALVSTYLCSSITTTPSATSLQP